MSKREATIQLINELPEYKLEIVSAFIRFLVSNDVDNYEEDLRHSIRQADHGQFVVKSLEELRAMEE